MEFVEFWWNANGINNETNGINWVERRLRASYWPSPFNPLLFFSFFSSEWEEWRKEERVDGHWATKANKKKWKVYFLFLLDCLPRRVWVDGMPFSSLVDWWVMGGSPPMAPPKKTNAKRRKAWNQWKQRRRKRENEEKATWAAVNQLMNEMNGLIDGAHCFSLHERSTKQPRCAASQHFIQFFSLYEGEEWMKWRREIGRRQLNGRERETLRWVD